MDPSGLPHRAHSRLAELVSRMREAGWDPSAEEVAEALWLARWADRGAREAGRPDPLADGAQEEGGAAAEPSGRDQRPSDRRPSGSEAAPGPLTDRAPPVSTVSLYAPDRHGGAPGSAFPVRAPAASTLPGLLGLQRAMRPLLGYRPRLPSVPCVLDEAASAELSARSGAVRPVFGPTQRPDAELLLLMDASATTSVWQLTFEKLRQTCERLGAFRDVQALCLHRGSDGAPLIGTGPDRSATRLRPADQYRDTTGRRLTLVVSDCVGTLWQDGGAQRLLHRWSGRSPLAVVQPLPPRLWPRTALPGEPGLLVRDKGAGGPVTFEPDGYGPPPARDALPVPVLLPTPAALGSWARLLGGEGRQTVRGAAAWVRPRHHAMPAPAASRDADARELLNAFRATASPGALDLAVHLAAVPLVLPVIQLVQEAMLPDTGSMELAEVLLSGLLERLPDVEDSPGPRYDFVQGVQELLLQSLDQGAAELVLKHLSEYVTRRFGKGTRNFPAMAVAQLSGRPTDVERGRAEPGESEDDEGELGEELFAEIPARVVRWYRPVRPLPDQLMDAERLLDQWRVQRDSKLLREAHEVTEAVLSAAEDSEWARRVLGRVLFAQAGTPEARRAPERRRQLLTRAENLLSGEGPERPATVLARAGVQHELWRMDGDSDWLRAVVRDLSAPLEGEESDPATQEDRRVRLGRALLDLARTEQDREAAAEPATAAVAQLQAAAGLSEAAGVSAQRKGAVLLDLVAALRLTGGAEHAQVLALLADAEPAVKADPAAPGGRNLLLRWARMRARVHREAGDWQAADEAYEEAAELTARDTPQRCELFIEWGETRLLRHDDPDSAEGILREALTGAPASGPLPARAQLLLGRALVRRWERGQFPPDRFEGCHLLELAARHSPDAVQRAESWRRLGDVRLASPDAEPPFTLAERAYRSAVSEARTAPGERRTGSVEAARALHALAALYERRDESRAALAGYREAAEEWHLLAGALASVPWAEAGRTRGRIAALEGGDPGGSGGAE